MEVTDMFQQICCCLKLKLSAAFDRAKAACCSRHCWIWGFPLQLFWRRAHFYHLWVVLSANLSITFSSPSGTCSVQGQVTNIIFHLITHIFGCSIYAWHFLTDHICRAFGACFVLGQLSDIFQSVTWLSFWCVYCPVSAVWHFSVDCIHTAFGACSLLGQLCDIFRLITYCFWCVFLSWAHCLFPTRSHIWGLLCLGPIIIQYNITHLVAVLSRINCLTFSS